MKIPSSNSLFQSLVVTRASADIRNWQPGQQLQATVTSRLENGLVNLRIGATILTAELQADVKIGEKLLLEVVSGGDKPVLRGIRNDSLQQLLESAIRQTLPKQQSHAQLLSDIEFLLKQKQLSVLPEKVQQALRQLQQSFTDRNAISNADGVRQAIRQSGLFMEARLIDSAATGSINLEHDLKAGLLRLQRAIQQQLTATQGGQRPVDGADKVYSPAPGRTFTPGQANVNPLRPAQFDTAARLPGTQVQQQNAVNPSAATTTTNTGPVSGANNPAGSSTRVSGEHIPILPGSTNPQAGRATPALNTSPPGQGNTTGLPLHLSLSHRGDPSQVSKIQAPFIYAGSVPFKLSADIDNSRPSARFSKLDNLTKILAMFLKDADSSLARIQLNQLTQLHTEPEQKPAWLFEVPVRHKDSIDLFQFKIEKDGDRNQDGAEDKETGWTVHIAFNIEQLGQVHSKVSIHQKQVSIIFWTEQQQTTTTFLDHMQTLQQELEDSGLVVSHLNCIQGKPPESPGTRINNGMVDEKA